MQEATFDEQGSHERQEDWKTKDSDKGAMMGGPRGQAVAADYRV